jgi:hypothetical protein
MGGVLDRALHRTAVPLVGPEAGLLATAAATTSTLLEGRREYTYQIGLGLFLSEFLVLKDGQVRLLSEVANSHCSS